jgi:phospholipase C
MARRRAKTTQSRTVRPELRGRRGRDAAALSILIVACVAVVGVPFSRQAIAASSPIKHVVVIDEENHSFDNVLGYFCAQIAAHKLVRPGLGDGCDGVTTGTLPDGTTIPLAKPPDIVPDVTHSVEAQQRAIDGGKMDGFGLIQGCRSTDPTPDGCFTQDRGREVANVWNFASNFAISDRTFELRQTPSWAGHIALVAATTDGFQGDNPTYISGEGVPHKGPGWGCDSNKSVQWWNGTSFETVPSCIPDQTGAGPFTTSPVPYVPTIFDLLDQAGLSWRIYGSDGANPHSTGYLWTICPSFYECLGSAQRSNLVPEVDVVTAANEGTLPTVSFVTPLARTSEHNGNSMLLGDDWLGQVLGAIEHGPEWDSTAVFLTWDDCGCFYDHVNPLQYGSDWGIRVPMIIVSPYARQGYTDSTPAVFASMLAYMEHTFGLPSLHPCNGLLGCTDDSNVYDYANAFDYSQTPLPPIPVHITPVPQRERRYLQEHPAPPDVT